MFVGWSDSCGRSGGQVLFGVVLFDTDVGDGITLFIGNLFDEICPECDRNSTRVVRNGAALQHGNKKPFFMMTSRMESIRSVRIPFTVAN